MSRGNLVGLNFDGVVVNRATTSGVCGMVEIVGLRKTIRQLTHRGLDVVFVTSREGEEFEAVELFMKTFKLSTRLVGIGRNCHNGKRINTTDMLVYVSDQISDLRPLKGIVPNLFLFSLSTVVPPDVGSTIKKVVSHHELLTELSRCLPHK